MKNHFLKQYTNLKNRLSIPRSGHTILGSIKNFGKPIYMAYVYLVNKLEDKNIQELLTNHYNNNYDFFNCHLILKNNNDGLIRIISSALILNWLIGRYIGILNTKSTLYDAEKWFYGKLNENSFLNNVLGYEEQSIILQYLKKVEFTEQFIDMLPYILEVFETSDEILNSTGKLRKHKRSQGIFYTPSDVADYIVRFTASLQKNFYDSPYSYRWIDPSCGTGIFLLSILKFYYELDEFQTGNEIFNFVSQSLFGIDVSITSLQSTAYLLALFSMRKEISYDQSLQKLLYKIGKNLKLSDSTLIKSTTDLNILFPKITTGFDFIVTNPPYYKKKIFEKNTQLSLSNNIGCNKTKSYNIYLDFIKLITRLSSKYCSAGLIVPLSISYNSQNEFREIRNYMNNSSGVWRFAHFDRTPDSIFGDDVKTRNTIIFYKNIDQNHSRYFYTTKFIRWSSRSRNELFENIPFCKIEKTIPNKAIPKISDYIERDILNYLNDNGFVSLSKDINHVDNLKNELYIRNSKTAYNWLPFEIYEPNNFKDQIYLCNINKYRYWSVINQKFFYSIFSILHSKLAYWLWRVWGDGFHLTDSFILSLPLSTKNFSDKSLLTLHRIGYKIWKIMKNNISINKNAGKSSISFNPVDCFYLIDQIDKLIISEYMLPFQMLNYLKKFVFKTIIAGRYSEIEINPAFKNWKKIIGERCEQS